MFKIEIMENEQNKEHPQQRDYQNEGESENEKANYTSLPTDGPISESEGKGTSDLQNTDKEEAEDISGDLAGNASGNDDADDQ